MFSRTPPKKLQSCVRLLYYCRSGSSTPVVVDLLVVVHVVACNTPYYRRGNTLLIKRTNNTDGKNGPHYYALLAIVKDILIAV